MTDKNDPAMPVTSHDPECRHYCCQNFFSGLNAVEHAAIALRVPKSGTPWIDDMIRRAQELDFAKTAATHFHWLVMEDASIAKRCFEVARALLEESEKEK